LPVACLLHCAKHARVSPQGFLGYKNLLFAEDRQRALTSLKGLSEEVGHCGNALIACQTAFEEPDGATHCSAP